LGPRKPGIYINIKKKIVSTSQKTLHYKALSFMKSRNIVFLENHTKSTKSFSEIKNVQIFYIKSRNREFLKDLPYNAVLR
jgi:hypothetical protein